MKDHGISLNQHCPCSQNECPIRGNCALCVQNHLEHRRHIPECFQTIMRPEVETLAAMLELQTSEARRPAHCSWRDFDKGDFVRASKRRHSHDTPQDL